MSICALLFRLGSLAIAATLLFACSQTANLSRSVTPAAPAPQSITSLNESSTATGPSQFVDVGSAEPALSATQIAPSQAFIPQMIASALAGSVNFDLGDAEHMTSSVISSPIGSAELFGELPTYSNQPFQRWLDVLARFNAQQTDPQYSCVKIRRRSARLPGGRSLSPNSVNYHSASACWSSTRYSIVCPTFRPKATGAIRPTGKRLSSSLPTQVNVRTTRTLNI